MEELNKELNEQELEKVTGGTGPADGYYYARVFFEGSDLILYAGYEVSQIHVSQNGSEIRYTYKMASGQREKLSYNAAAPLQFTVSGYCIKYHESFEYTFTL